MDIHLEDSLRMVSRLQDPLMLSSPPFHPSLPSSIVATRPWLFLRRGIVCRTKCRSSGPYVPVPRDPSVSRVIPPASIEASHGSSVRDPIRMQRQSLSDHDPNEDTFLLKRAARKPQA